jgi:hypothetical protein
LTVFWSEPLASYSRPFDTCPRKAFAVIMMATPYLSKVLKGSINNLVIHYQHDNYFKFSFSQLLMHLYNSLYGLYIRYVGIPDGHIFSTSVQVFTANSIVDCLSTDGYTLRPFTEMEPRPVSTNIFMNVLKYSLSHMGCQGVRCIHNLFLSHPNLTHQRLSNLFRDIDYILKSPIACARILAERRDPGMVRIYIY